MLQTLCQAVEKTSRAAAGSMRASGEPAGQNMTIALPLTPFPEPEAGATGLPPTAPGKNPLAEIPAEYPDLAGIEVGEVLAESDLMTAEPGIEVGEPTAEEIAWLRSRLAGT